MQGDSISSTSVTSGAGTPQVFRSNYIRARKLPELSMIYKDSENSEVEDEEDFKEMHRDEEYSVNRNMLMGS